MDVDSDTVADDEEMENEKKEKREEKEVGSVKLSVWRTSNSHGYNGLLLMYRCNRYSFFELDLV